MVREEVPLYFCTATISVWLIFRFQFVDLWTYEYSLPYLGHVVVIILVGWC
jgi:hypothetical protein